MLPNTKLTLEKLLKTFKILPKRRNFANSGHTDCIYLMFGYVIIETAWADIDLHFLLLKSFMGSLYDLYIQSNIFPKHAFYVQHPVKRR